ncbi:hypothetical protein BBJK_03230 [Bifidobacterium bifidum LMG 13195]|uniref:Uncharacterized protein n=1 Tax=Bifidobacterium bifidum LMG 13195 TaxID=1207542 RepID=A0A286TG31_BIFBI|nr:hypothetical protein BBJK_03230 [Bifidobacterium bifidum LMG 13195]
MTPHRTGSCTVSPPAPIVRSRRCRGLRMTPARCRARRRTRSSWRSSMRACSLPPTPASAWRCSTGDQGAHRDTDTPGQRQAAFTESQVEDVIAVIHNTLRGVPIDLRELVLNERDNGDALRRRMQAGDMSVDDILTSYTRIRRSFSESDSGRRFEDAFQVIITDEGRQQIDAALRDIAHTPYLAASLASCSIRCVPSFRASMTASRRCVARCAYPTRRSAVCATADRYPIPHDARQAQPSVCPLNADAKAHQGDDAETDRTIRGRQVPRCVAPRAPDGTNEPPRIVRTADTGDATRARPAFDDRQRGARLRRMAALSNRPSTRTTGTAPSTSSPAQRAAESRAEGKRARRFPGRARGAPHVGPVIRKTGRSQAVLHARQLAHAPARRHHGRNLRPDPQRPPGRRLGGGLGV